MPVADLPAERGNRKMVYNRHRRWSGDGTWERVLDALRAGGDAAQGEAWAVAADWAAVRGHQPEAGSAGQR